MLHVHHAFLYISLSSLHDYDIKMPIFNFYSGSNGNKVSDGHNNNKKGLKEDF